MDAGRIRTKSAHAVGVSVAALDKRLGLRRRAREDASQNLPRQDAQSLSPTETAIIEMVAAEREQVDQARQEAKTEAERRLRMLALAPQDFSGPAIEARLALKQASGRLSHDWQAASSRAKQARADLDSFKRINQLRRSAVYPDSTLMQAGLLLSAALFESLFSAALFAEELDGLLGGAVVAIGLSGANVALGFLSGYLGLRYLQHVRMPVKAAGALAFGVLGLLALMLNLFAADWRDRLATASGVRVEGSDAGFHLWSLLSLDSPQAIILLMLGAGVWAFASLKGYSGFDDPYPDYSKMDRAAALAAEDLSEFRNAARETLEAPIETAKAALAARTTKLQAEFEAMNKAFDAAAQKLGALDDQARALDGAVAAAVQLYRQENAAARGSPAPAYFGAPPPHAGPALDPLAQCGAIVDEARTTLAEAHAKSAQALEALVQELDAAAKHLDRGETS
ncbi:MAG: hypothetical protein ABL883_05555 [Terricaulis sp.]